ncbi:MAG TPA: alpha/beta fold hydrolase [Candidatus Acidoferrales bacterium]|nr:alpha/beta fold hydrolase [Candidatus Acidoferrales bacterium]
MSILVFFGCTVIPLEGANFTMPGYYSDAKEAVRQKINQWIRSSGAFDGVIDTDKILRDPDHPTRIAWRTFGRIIAGILALLLLVTTQASAQSQPAPATEASAHTDARTSNAKQQSQASDIQPFKVHVADSVLEDLDRRLAATRWPDQLPGTTSEYGVDIKKVRELADYWQKQFNWRAQEARINSFDQFTTEIDGQRIHFIHERSPRADAIPLLLIHGWPGSFLEFLKMIEPLTQPKNASTPAFDVVIPSLPGFGFSGPTTARGWGPKRMASALIALMDRLGYSRYGVQGGDWGSEIARDIARQAPEHVIGLHLNLLYADPPNQEAVAKMSDFERRRYSYFQSEESSFFNLQSSEPQTLAYALTDSPVGWLAWMIDKFQFLTDNNGDFLTAVDRDTFLTDVTLYWVTGTIGSAMRIYRENRLEEREAAPLPYLKTPVAFADFPKEVYSTPLSWIEQSYNVVQYTRMPRGGHFAALEQPDLLVADIRKFFPRVNDDEPMKPVTTAPDEPLGSGFESKFAKVNGTELHYVRGGSGPAVVLLHGFPEDWYEFRRVMPLLAQRFTVIAVDLRGVGESAPSDNGYDAANLAEDLHQLVASLSLGHVYVVGHDVGGMVAYAFARRYGETARGVMILDSAFPGLDPWQELVDRAWHVRFNQSDVAEKLVSGRQAEYFRYFLGELSDADVDHYAYAYRDPDHLPAAFETYRAFPADAKFFAAQTGRTDIPLVIGAGEHDVVETFLPRIAAAMRAHGCTNVDVETIQGAGHYVADEAPNALAKLVERFAAVSPKSN